MLPGQCGLQFEEIEKQRLVYQAVMLSCRALRSERVDHSPDVCFADVLGFYGSKILEHLDFSWVARTKSIYLESGVLLLR